MAVEVHLLFGVDRLVSFGTDVTYTTSQTPWDLFTVGGLILVVAAIGTLRGASWGVKAEHRDSYGGTIMSVPGHLRWGGSSRRGSQPCSCLFHGQVKDKGLLRVQADYDWSSN